MNETVHNKRLCLTFRLCPILANSSDWNKYLTIATMSKSLKEFLKTSNEIDKELHEDISNFPN